MTKDLIDDLTKRAQAFVDQRYVARADDRQRAMGLAYVTAERQDLARQIARFTLSEAELFQKEAACHQAKQ